MSEPPDAGRDRPANPTEPIPGEPSNPTLPLSKPGAGAPAGSAEPAQSALGGQMPPHAQPYGQQGPYVQNPYPPPAGRQEGYPQQPPYPQQGFPPPYGAPYGGPGQPYYNVTGYVEQKSRLVGGLLGILLGGLGIHRFYLGYTAIGVLQIVVTFLTFGFGAIWGFVEGIMILVGAEPFRRDARGVPLKE
ncbi:TM2 domain-containing protein [Arthrobacter sp. GCM10027362]|uniref:TM2 domain-containing protein n=1 Tax=Arthrobacter sp. GCM10027362 TaxID=3273379 RepID=UPI00362A0130